MDTIIQVLYHLGALGGCVCSICVAHYFIYTLTINPQPPFATLDAAMTRDPTMTRTPPKVHVCVNPVALRIWPEMGVPISRPTETTVIER
jgi:hypothetical protein